jgi:hypothetical protein
MARRRNYRRYSNSRASYASQIRDRHVREAEEFSEEIGGTDKDVKEYFFSLSGSELANILSEYGRLWGEKSEDYAKVAFPRWKKGSTRMSGQTAKRLFDLLPPRMPLKNKYALVENLWKKLGPRSHKILEVGVNAAPNRVLEEVRNYIGKTVDGFVLPAALENRFKWLAANDVHVQQQLLNHFQELEKKQVVDLFRIELPVLLKHRSSSSGVIQGMKKVLKINNHEFEVQFLSDGQEVTLKDYQSSPQIKGESEQSYAWIFWLIAVVIGLYLLNS